MGDQCHPQYLLGSFLRLFGMVYDFNTSSLPSSASMDLGFYYDCLSSNPFGNPSCFLRSLSHTSFRDRNAISFQNFLGLIFVNLHSISSPL
jgi:hypothetical protein